MRKSGETQIRQIAVLAYGSLLAHPGEWLGQKMERLIRCETPFGVEYLGRSESRRGGAPTLVRWRRAKPVRGGLIVLRFVDQSDELALVREQLALREIGKKDVKRIKDDLEVFGYRAVYAVFAPKFDPNDVGAIARAALDSVGRCSQTRVPFMNGIRYLMENLEWGVETRLTAQYKQAILEMTSSKSLEEAEHKQLVKAYDQGP